VAFGGPAAAGTSGFRSALIVVEEYLFIHLMPMGFVLLGLFTLFYVVLGILETVVDAADLTFYWSIQIYLVTWLLRAPALWVFPKARDTSPILLLCYLGFVMTMDALLIVYRLSTVTQDYGLQLIKLLFDAAILYAVYTNFATILWRRWRISTIKLGRSLVVGTDAAKDLENQ